MIKVYMSCLSLEGEEEYYRLGEFSYDILDELFNTIKKHSFVSSDRIQFSEFDSFFTVIGGAAAFEIKAF